METVLLNIWMWGLLSVLVLIGIYHGWKGNNFSIHRLLHILHLFSYW